MRIYSNEKGGDMKIETHHIPSRGLVLNYQKQASEFIALKEMAAAGECLFKKPVTIDLEVTQEKDFFAVAGQLTGVVTLSCSRCLEPYELSLKRHFNLTYSQKIPQELHGRDAQDAELTAEQIGVVFFKGDTIDFSEAVQEQIVMALPYKALCNEACKGLCRQCGVDFNHNTCQCDGRPTSSPFDVLKDLKLSSQ